MTTRRFCRIFQNDEIESRIDISAKRSPDIDIFSGDAQCHWFTSNPLSPQPNPPFTAVASGLGASWGEVNGRRRCVTQTGKTPPERNGNALQQVRHLRGVSSFYGNVQSSRDTRSLM